MYQLNFYRLELLQHFTSFIKLGPCRAYNKSSHIPIQGRDIIMPTYAIALLAMEMYISPERNAINLFSVRK